MPVATLYLSFQCSFLDYTTRQWLGLSLLFWIVTKPVYPNHLVLELLCNFVQIVVKDLRGHGTTLSSKVGRAVHLGAVEDVSERIHRPLSSLDVAIRSERRS